MKHIQTIKIPKENPYQLTDFKNLKKKICKPKDSSLLPIFVISKRKPYP
jgi:hypothetical protein